MKRYILASGSPRRKKLAGETGIDFEIMLPLEEEDILNLPFNYKTVEENAKMKGMSVLKRIDFPAIVVSADTVVVNDNKILGKPRDFDDAYDMLKSLRGKTHTVVTSVCVADSETKKIDVKSDTSEVTFKNFSDEQIKKYINDYKPYDKAGAYGIQEMNEDYVENVTGDINNVVGLPVNMLKKMLDEMNKEIK